ncbi:hypothetical protein TNIN_471481, partial [Trichonephila inaurata madagascariensis]
MMILSTPRDRKKVQGCHISR